VTNVSADSPAGKGRRQVARRTDASCWNAPAPAGGDRASPQRSRRARSRRRRHPDPGRTETFHRLNRAEYQNAIRDLLALDVNLTTLLPADEISYGFDNIAGVLKLSPLLIGAISALRARCRLALGTPGPQRRRLRVPDQLDQDVRLRDADGDARRHPRHYVAPGTASM
jgi:hypothetical protein